MTKYEWERQLKKGISGLPKSEQQRVLDYYNELFADKIDAGFREQYIIAEFGNPYDVANKILTDFYNGDKDNPEADAYIYADSDDIDDEFAEESEKFAKPLKHKTWTERRDERRAERRERQDEIRNADRQQYAEDFDDETDDSDKKFNKKGAKSASSLVVLICVLVYCVLGACFHLWHPGWLIFVAMPCVVTLIEAIQKRDWRIFAYPMFVVFLFLLIGFDSHAWHPAWILFVTIPLYYALGNFICKNADGTKRADKKVQSETKRQAEEIDNTHTERVIEIKPAKKTNRNNVISLIAKILMTLCLIGVALLVWHIVLGVFLGGIGMIVGSVACLVEAFASAATNWLLAGVGIALLGLGLICTFGMAAMFRACVGMCKSFAKTIKKSFDDREVA